MRAVLFCHSILSDWNHGNAHFLRGVATELLARGHEVRIFEPRGAWSFENLVAEYGEQAVRKGIEPFLAPGEEILVARNGEEVAAHLAGLTAGRARARARVLAEHTAAHRAAELKPHFRQAAQAGQASRPVQRKARS